MVTAAPRQQPGGFFCRMERAQCRAAAGNARHGFPSFLKKHLQNVISCGIIPGHDEFLCKSQRSPCCGIGRDFYYQSGPWPLICSERGEQHEGRHPSQLSADYHSLCLRRSDRDRFHQKGHSRRNLLQVSPFLYRQAEAG